MSLVNRCNLANLSFHINSQFCWSRELGSKPPRPNHRPGNCLFKNFDCLTWNVWWSSAMFCQCCIFRDQIRTDMKEISSWNLKKNLLYRIGHRIYCHLYTNQQCIAPQKIANFISTAVSALNIASWRVMSKINAISCLPSRPAIQQVEQ